MTCLLAMRSRVRSYMRSVGTGHIALLPAHGRLIGGTCRAANIIVYGPDEGA